MNPRRSHIKFDAAAARSFLRSAYLASCEGLGVIGRPLLLSKAEDITFHTTTRSSLVLAPHPDDETLGCGGTIMRKRAAGTTVNVVIASDGRHSHQSTKLSANTLAEIREQEARRAGTILGLRPENIFFLRFEDRRLAANRGRLHDRLLNILDTLNPEEVFVSSIIDNHPDHRILAQLARELMHARPDRFLLYEYPIWFWDPRVWRIKELLALRVRIVRMEEFRIRKHEAIAGYRSQVGNPIGEPGWATLPRSLLRQCLQPEETFFEVSPPQTRVV
jgi:LmbE family N-acetylglucosaminyl deacetylase